jgi:HD superfamily phosphohydrolase
MPGKHVLIDPIHGKIEIPHWLFRIQDEPAIRRMMGIKQLGLKAYIDFPGAIHTRYTHCLGVMYLAGKLTDLLMKKYQSNSSIDQGLHDNLKNNHNCLMAAGFFHDIGHGPFSHVMDYVLKSRFGTDHETITTNIVDFYEKELEGDSIPSRQVKKIITKKHQYPFLSSVINGPLDVDKVDYILRDSYHVGLKYSFDSEHFFDHIVILGDKKDLKKCELGLENSEEAFVGAALFLMLWKSMYTLVYLVDSSRKAEKMLEKAILVALNNKSELEEHFKDIKKYVDLDEATLLAKLRLAGDFPKNICDRIIKTAQLYDTIETFDLESFEANDKFIKSLTKSDDQVSDRISLELSKTETEPYSIICDIIRSKTPKDIHVDKIDEDGEPIDVKDKSDVIEALSHPKLLMKIYADKNIKMHKLIAEEKLKSKIQLIIDGW